jgi:hypothetical protein
MNLEQRVQALEQEVELLKAQIQATLLDIQEQLLNNTYPTLRAEGTSVQAQAAPEVRAASPATALPIKRVTLTESEPDDDLDVEEDVQQIPVVRKKVQLEELTQPSLPERTERPAKQVQPEPQPRPARRERIEPTVTDQPDESLHDWNELENWVSQKVETMGIKRTRELIDLYARQERFTRQERELLMQFVDIYDDDEEQQQTVIPTSFSRTPSSEPLKIAPQTRAVVEDLRAELREKRAKSNRKQEIRPEDLSEQQGLMLRLIAGILNAGDDETPAPRNGHRKR